MPSEAALLEYDMPMQLALLYIWDNYRVLFVFRAEIIDSHN